MPASPVSRSTRGRFAPLAAGPSPSTHDPSVTQSTPVAGVAARLARTPVTLRGGLQVAGSGSTPMAQGSRRVPSVFAVVPEEVFDRRTTLGSSAPRFRAAVTDAELEYSVTESPRSNNRRASTSGARPRLMSATGATLDGHARDRAVEAEDAHRRRHALGHRHRDVLAHGAKLPGPRPAEDCEHLRL